MEQRFLEGFYLFCKMSPALAVFWWLGFRAGRQDEIKKAKIFMLEQRRKEWEAHK